MPEDGTMNFIKLPRKFNFYLAIIVILLRTTPALAQETDTWDNQLFVGNKVVYGRNKWNYSGELQFRLKDNLQALDNWFLEGVATYLASKYWEIVPDYRFSVKPTSTEYRPGLGVLFKLLSPKWQFVNQVKYQADMSSKGTVGHGLRHVVFLNRILTEKLVPTLAAGYFYRWKENFSDLEFIRFGAGINILFDPVHTLTISYFVGVANTGKRWNWSGIPLLQLTIRIRKDWIYVPAKYINF